MSCYFPKESGVLKLVRPGRIVETHRCPITAAEVMQRNPRHCVTRPDVFKYPWVVIKPESVLKPGRIYFLVPYYTIRCLLKKYGSPENYHSTSKQCQDSEGFRRAKLTSRMDLSDDTDAGSTSFRKGEYSDDSLLGFSSLMRKISPSEDASQIFSIENLENESKSVRGPDQPFQYKHVMNQSLVRPRIDQKKQSPVKCPEEIKKQMLANSSLQRKKQSRFKPYGEVEEPLVVRSPLRITNLLPAKTHIEMKSAQENYKSPRKKKLIHHRTKAFAHYKNSPKLVLRPQARSPFTKGKVLQQTCNERSGVSNPLQVNNLKSCLKKNGRYNFTKPHTLKVQFNIPDEDETRCRFRDQEETKWRFEAFAYTKNSLM